MLPLPTKLSRKKKIIDVTITIYDDYDQEPDDVFEPLPEKLYCEFYDVEMGGYLEDAQFWASQLPMERVLEMGCGSGRLSRTLAGAGFEVIGIDRSSAMLDRAREQSQPLSSPPVYLQMDMCHLAFSSQYRFDVLLIPYNTLNLLTIPGQLKACLSGCRSHLAFGGILAVQLHLFEQQFLNKKEKTFQFQLFDLPGGGRLIKESLKRYDSSLRLVEVEERYRLRPMQDNKENRDYSISYTLCAFTKEKIRSLFEENGWGLEKQWGDFQGNPYSGGGRWLGIFSSLSD